MERVIIGSDKKIGVYVEPVNGYHISDPNVQLSVTVKSERSLTFTKEQMHMVDDDNYVIPLVTDDIGLGVITCEIDVRFPDPMFPDGDMRIIKRCDAETKVVK